jgi:hypothetical protein
MPLTFLLPATFDQGWEMSQWLLVGAIAVLTASLCLSVRLGRESVRPLRRLLGRPKGDVTPVTVFLRGMFVPGNEYFARVPEYPPGSGAGVTVHKLANISEVFSAPDVRAAGEVLQLLVASNPSLAIHIRASEGNRRGWDEDAVAIGPHYKSVQILDACEPRLIAFRNPDAFRSVASREVFEAKGGIDYGLIYRGEHPASHRVFWVVMGLGDLGTESAAWFLRANALLLSRLTGAAPFAAVVAVETARGRETAQLKFLQPKPRWWRRLRYRKAWLKLSGATHAGPA